VKTKKQHGGAGRGQGRKPLHEGVPTVTVSMKMTEPQRDKLQRLGGAQWVRERIDRAAEPSSAATRVSRAFVVPGALQSKRR
jgi:hypothetical protein